jgi:hypothetical protein
MPLASVRWFVVCGCGRSCLSKPWWWDWIISWLTETISKHTEHLRVWAVVFERGNLTRVTRVLGPGSTYERWKLPRAKWVGSCSTWPWRIYLGRKKLPLSLLHLLCSGSIAAERSRGWITYLSILRKALAKCGLQSLRSAEWSVWFVVMIREC